MRWLAVAVFWLFFVAEAAARVGGGQDYSGGGGGGGGGYSGGGGYGGGGGGDGGGALLYMLLRLCIEAPAIGIPLTIVVVGGMIYMKSHSGGQGSWTAGGQRRPAPRPIPRGEAIRPTPKTFVPKILQDDPNFSLPLFLDWVNLVYVRGQNARGTGASDRLAEHFAPPAADALLKNREGLTEVRDVIVGSTAITGLQQDGGRMLVEVTFESNVTEQRAQATTLLMKERWVFSRKLGVLSPGPDKLRTLGCPSCGATQDPKPDGRCPNCDTQRTGGENQWQVTRIELLSKKAISPPELGSSGVEAGTSLPTRYDPDLPVKRRQFDSGHPEHDWNAFRARVQDIFLRLQVAWDASRVEDMRPYESDSLFQQHRFWMERYARFGLRNRLDDVRVEKVEIARIDTDAYYESVTTRINASMRDWTIRVSDEKVMGGSPTQTRRFSEYWTFIRTIGTQHKAAFDPEHCPSCGAPLDKVSMAGVCGYCEAKIVTGDFDWILSRIEQDEAYTG